MLGKLFTTILLLISSEMVFAQSVICSDANQIICKDTVSERKARDQYIANLKREISAEAQVNAKVKIAEMEKRISKIHFIKRAIRRYLIRNRELMNASKARIGDLEKVVTDASNVEKLKNYFYQAIDSSPYNDATKADFKAKIGSVVIGNFADYIERSDLDDSIMMQILNNACGSDGMVENAFATTIKNQRYVLICPGFLVTLSQSATDEERFNSILHAIAHEMGHHIDNSQVGNDLYAPYFNCLASNFSNQFVKSKEDQKFCSKKDQSAAACNLKVVQSHGGELVADQWGILVTAIHANTQRYNVSESEKMLVDSWSKLCDSGDEGIHPTGTFRMGNLMSLNPVISEILSCGSERAVKPACTFNGAK